MMDWVNVTDEFNSIIYDILLDLSLFDDSVHHFPMNLIFFISIILFQSSLVLAQSIPNNHFLYQSRKLLYDAGKDWQSLTVFGPIRFKSKPERELKNLRMIHRGMQKKLKAMILLLEKKH